MLTVHPAKVAAVIMDAVLNASFGFSNFFFRSRTASRVWYNASEAKKANPGSFRLSGGLNDRFLRVIKLHVAKAKKA